MIYLDHDAATPLRPGVLDAMAEAAQLGGNVSSLHGLGRVARRKFEGVIDKVRAYFHSARAEVIFTGSLSEAAALAGQLTVCDVSAHIGCVPFERRSGDYDALIFEAATFGGPRGIAGLVYAKGLPVEPLWYGGGQQGGIRPGTPPLPLIVGLGAALEHAKSHPSLAVAGVLERDSRDICAALIKQGAQFANGALPNTFFVRFSDISCAHLLKALSARGVMVGISHQLLLNNESPTESLRFSTGWNTSAAELQQALEILLDVVKIGVGGQA